MFKKEEETKTGNKCLLPCLVIAAALSQLMRVDVNEPSVSFIVYREGGKSLS